MYMTLFPVPYSRRVKIRVKCMLIELIILLSISSPLFKIFLDFTTSLQNSNICVTKELSILIPKSSLSLTAAEGRIMVAKHLAFLWKKGSIFWPLNLVFQWSLFSFSREAEENRAVQTRDNFVCPSWDADPSFGYSIRIRKCSPACPYKCNTCHYFYSIL